MPIITQIDVFGRGSRNALLQLHTMSVSSGQTWTQPLYTIVFFSFCWWSTLLLSRLAKPKQKNIIKLLVVTPQLPRLSVQQQLNPKNVSVVTEHDCTFDKCTAKSSIRTFGASEIHWWAALFTTASFLPLRSSEAKISASPCKEKLGLFTRSSIIKIINNTAVRFTLMSVNCEK